MCLSRWLIPFTDEITGNPSRSKLGTLDDVSNLAMACGADHYAIELLYACPRLLIGCAGLNASNAPELCQASLQGAWCVARVASGGSLPEGVRCVGILVASSRGEAPYNLRVWGSGAGESLPPSSPPRHSGSLGPLIRLHISCRYSTLRNRQAFS